MELNGPGTGYGNFFAAANFTDADAGANNGGLFSAIADNCMAENLIQNLQQSIMNLVADTTVSESEKIHELRKQFLALASNSYFKSLGELVKPIEDNANSVAIIGVLKNLSRADFNPFAQGHFKDLVLDVSGNFTNGSTDYDFKIIEEQLCMANKRYIELLPNLFEADKEIHAALNSFKLVENHIDQFQTLQTNAASAELYKSFTSYLMIFFQDLQLVEKFNRFTRLYREFTALRKLLNLRGLCNDEYQLPQCGICISNSVTFALTPCGHTFCQTCAHKQFSRCYICRADVSSRMKLYFS